MLTVRLRNRESNFAMPFPMELDQVSTYFLETWKNAILLGGFSPKQAKYQIKKFDGKSKKTITTAYQSIALDLCKLEVLNGKKTNRWGCYEMGSYLKLGLQRQTPEKNEISNKALVKKQKSIRSLFCQNKKSAAKYISNVEIGIFPSTKEVEQISRWSIDQQKRLDQARANGEWQGNDWINKEFDFMFSGILASSSAQQSQSDEILFKIYQLGLLGNNF